VRNSSARWWGTSSPIVFLRPTRTAQPIETWFGPKNLKQTCNPCSPRSRSPQWLLGIQDLRGCGVCGWARCYSLKRLQIKCNQIRSEEPCRLHGTISGSTRMSIAKGSKPSNWSCIGWIELKFRMELKKNCYYSVVYYPLTLLYERANDLTNQIAHVLTTNTLYPGLNDVDNRSQSGHTMQQCNRPLVD